MVIQKNFIRFASVCCFITVITTLGIHAFFPDPPASFDERILLFRNKTYLVNRWWVIVHCLLVIVAMWGFALLQLKKTPGLTGLGLFVLLRVWHCRDHAANDGAVLYKCFERTICNRYRCGDQRRIEDYSCKRRSAYRSAIRRFHPHVWIRKSLLWTQFDQNKRVQQTAFHHADHSGIVSFIVLGNNFWKIPAIDRVIEKYSYSFTPLLRALTGVWLWKKSNDL